MLTAEKRAQIIDALNANPNSTAVAKQIGGVSQATVWKIAKAAGIELTAGKAARGHPISAEKRAQIIEALKSNPNARQVARQIGGVSRVTVWKIAKAAGIELTARRHRASRTH
jgi:hypothetical protein